MADQRETGLRVVLMGATREDRDAVRAVLAGAGIEAAIETAPAEGAVLLSERERQVLTLVAEGLTNVEIGARLHLSRHTVKEYLSGAMRKLAVDNRVEAALAATRRGLIEPPASAPGDGRWRLTEPAPGVVESAGSILVPMDDHDIRLPPIKVRPAARA